MSNCWPRAGFLNFKDIRNTIEGLQKSRIVTGYVLWFAIIGVWFFLFTYYQMWDLHSDEIFSSLTLGYFKVIFITVVLFHIQITKIKSFLILVESQRLFHGTPRIRWTHFGKASSIGGKLTYYTTLIRLGFNFKFSWPWPSFTQGYNVHIHHIIPLRICTLYTRRRRLSEEDSSLFLPHPRST